MNNSLKTDEIFGKFMRVEKLKTEGKLPELNALFRNCEKLQKVDDIKREYLQFLLPFLRT